MSEGLSEARLTVALDLRHPLACLALRPALAFAAEIRAELGVETDWLPLEVPNLRPPSEPAPDDDRGAWHRRHRARAIAREIETYGAAQGVVLREPYREGDASPAHRGWLWVRERSPESLPVFLETLFRDYGSLALDASSPTAVAERVEAVKADGAGFLEWCEGEGAARAEALAAALRERGINSVPAFLADDEVFYGRQHLPMLRWILEGRSGPVPI